MRNRIRAQVTSEQRKRRAVFTAVIALVLVYLAASFLLGDMGYLSYKRLVSARGNIQAEVEAVKQRNVELEEEVRALKDDPEAIERLAREDLGLGREDELIFNFEK